MCACTFSITALLFYVHVSLEGSVMELFVFYLKQSHKNKRLIDMTAS